MVNAISHIQASWLSDYNGGIYDDSRQEKAFLARKRILCKKKHALEESTRSSLDVASKPPTPRASTTSTTRSVFPARSKFSAKKSLSRWRLLVTATKEGWTTGLPRTLGQHGEDSGQKYCENAKKKTKDRVDEHCKVWRGRLLQDQAWNWALWSEYLVVVVSGGLVNFYLFLSMNYHCSRWALFTIPLPIVLLEKTQQTIANRSSPWK